MGLQGIEAGIMRLYWRGPYKAERDRDQRLRRPEGTVIMRPEGTVEHVSRIDQDHEVGLNQ